MNLKIAILDDEQATTHKIKKLVEAGLKKTGHTASFQEINEDNDRQHLRDVLATLGQRRTGEEVPFPGPIQLDDAHLVFVDFDLQKLPLGSNMYTGDYIAELTRRYTTAGPIVSINRRGRRIFHLRHGRPPETRCDVALADDDLACSGLWGKAGSKYDPWYWPNILRLRECYLDRVAQLEENPDTPIVDVLGIKPEYADQFPSEIDELECDVLTMTPRKLWDHVVPAKERRFVPDECKARVAASLLGSWLNTTVMESQDILIDAPHLIRHCPSLFTDPKDLAGLLTRDSTQAVPINEDLVGVHAFANKVWLDRPAWWLLDIQNDRNIPDIAKPWERLNPGAGAFAEDLSRFIPKKSAREYRASGFFATRYVGGPDAHSENVSYEPQRNLAV